MKKIPGSYLIYQPYYIPFFPFWVLVASSDVFVLYDDTVASYKSYNYRRQHISTDYGDSTVYIKKEYEKTRCVVNGEIKMERGFRSNRVKESYREEINKLKTFFSVFPYFDEYSFLLNVSLTETSSLYDINSYFIRSIAAVLCRDTAILNSSEMNVVGRSKQDRVFAIGDYLNKSTYLASKNQFNYLSEAEGDIQKNTLFYNFLDITTPVDAGERYNSILYFLFMYGKEKTLELLNLSNFNNIVSILRVPPSPLNLVS